VVNGALVGESAVRGESGIDDVFLCVDEAQGVPGLGTRHHDLLHTWLDVEVGLLGVTEIDITALARARHRREAERGETHGDTPAHGRTVAAPYDRTVAEVRAEIAANVWQVRVEQGQQVAEGDELIILESMKMEIPVEAPVAGTVSDLRVVPEDQVQEGDVLAVIDE